MEHLTQVPRSALFAGMGTGKTVSTLTAVEAVHLSGYSRPALVLAPKRVAVSTWPDEALKWDHLSGLTVSPIVGTAAERAAALRRDASVYTLNYENLPWLFEHLDGRWPFGILIPDESTRLKSSRPSIRVSTKGKEYIQSAGAIRTRELARVAQTPGLIDYVWELTGTPAPNGLADLWAQLWFLDGGHRLGRTFEAFSQRWFRPKYNGYGIEPLPHAREEIFAKIADICLSVQFDGELPPLVPNIIEVDLPPKARALYKDMEKKLFLEIEGNEVEAFNAAAKTMKLMQLANGAIYTDDAGAWAEVHDAKLDALDSIMTEAAGAPVLVAYQFKSDVERIKRAFKQARVLDDKPKTIREWNAGKIPMLLAHPASAGHGLNLQDGGNILAFFSSGWDLELDMQIIERIGPVRQAQAGHDRPVFVHRIIARRTVDELVAQRRESKREVQDLLLEYVRAKG